MTPGNVCYTAYMESMRLERPYLPRYVLLDVANKAAWEAAANAVSGDLIAYNERLRAALEAQLSELMETYPCFGMGGGSKSEERAQAQWEKEHGQQKAFLTTALAPPAPGVAAVPSLALTDAQREAILAVIRNAQMSGIAFAYQKERQCPEYSPLRAIAEIETILEARVEREGNDEQAM